MILINGPIKPEFIKSCISKFEKQTDTGAHASFIGQVRADIVEGKKVKEIEYSAYDEMVEKEVGNIKSNVFSKYPELTNIDIYHSVGTVKAGEISLLVFIASRHRKPLFMALHDTIELIKEHLPVWKKEIFHDNSHIWTNNEEK
ncbi:MAG: molybdenum cofactor biosynthesis protein MoaE [Bacteroidota bacterium]